MSSSEIQNAEKLVKLQVLQLKVNRLIMREEVECERKMKITLTNGVQDIQFLLLLTCFW